MNVYELADALYRRGYEDRQKERSYDPRGTEEWQAVADALRGDCSSCHGSGVQGTGPGYGGCTDCLGTGRAAP